MLDKKKAMFEKAFAETSRIKHVLAPENKSLYESWYNAGWEDCLKAIQSALEPKPNAYDLKASRFNRPSATNAISGDKDKRGVR